MPRETQQRWSRALIVLEALSVVCAAGLGTACSNGAGPEPAADERRQDEREAAEAAIFQDRSREWGLDFTHFNGMSGELYMAEVLGAGGALVDYDNDGDLDIYLVQGAMLGPGKTLADALFPPPPGAELIDRLWRNDLADVGGRGGGKLTDVTAASGLRGDGYGMGVAVGDYDGDGWLDLYVTHLGENQLWHNQGDGTFVNVTATSGTGDPAWSVPAVFFDSDGDGRLDLFVGNYVAFDESRLPQCNNLTGARDYCGPGVFPAEPDRLYRNQGDGTFRDVTAATGLAAGFGPALGAVAADFDGDGRADLYVANDAQPNHLWRQHEDGVFVDDALLAGCAVNGAGQAEGSMGVDSGDFDGDGDLDLFMTHLHKETNTLYVNDGGGSFEDRTTVTGLGPASQAFTSFGTAWLDYDNDGWLDLLVVNGAVTHLPELVRQQDPFPLHQPNQLFRNTGDGRFVDVTAQAGPAFQLSEVSRGAAIGDLDNDGDTDVLITQNKGPARLLINEVGHRRPWLGVRLTTGEPARDALGARAVLRRPGSRDLWRWVRVDGSYASASDPRLLFGLGEDAGGDELVVQVYWPGGASEIWRDLEPGRYVTLQQGRGEAVAAPR